MRAPTRAKAKEKGRVGVRITRLSLRSLQRCRFEHVDTPKKAAPSKAAPKVPAGVAVLAAASTGASACHVPSSFVRGFRATCRLITAPFRVFARFAAAFSFALPATVHHSHDRIAATVSRPNWSGRSYFLVLPSREPMLLWKDYVRLFFEL